MKVDEEGPFMPEGNEGKSKLEIENGSRGRC